MVRGAAKAQAQAKAQKKADSHKSAGSQLEDQKKGLKLMCPVCKTMMPSYKLFQTHHEAKHSGPCPSEEAIQVK